MIGVFSPIPSWSCSYPFFSFSFFPSLDLPGNMVHMFILLPRKATPAFTLHTSTLPCFPNVQRFVRRNFKVFHNFQSWQLDHCLPSASYSENKLPFPLLSLIPIPRNFRMFCDFSKALFFQVTAEYLRQGHGSHTQVSSWDVAIPLLSKSSSWPQFPHCSLAPFQLPSFLRWGWFPALGN